MFNALLVLLTLLYPAAVYFGVEHLEPKYFALTLVALFAARYFLSRRSAPASWALPLFIVIALFAGWTFVANSKSLLLFYPVIVNAVLLAAFAGSLIFPPPVIERLARISEPDLPASAITYTRRVTVAWCFFFR